jgi:hypothetical protein
MFTSMNRSLTNVYLGGAFAKTNVKSTVVAGEKPILEHSEATIATVFDALITLSARETNSQKRFCSATTITNDAQRIHHFCSREQLAEARNAITCDDKN